MYDYLFLELNINSAINSVYCRIYITVQNNYTSI